jgi:translation elongation factor EF-1beta
VSHFVSLYEDVSSTQFVPMTSLAPHDISIDELRVALGFASPGIVPLLKPLALAPLAAPFVSKQSAEAVAPVAVQPPQKQVTQKKESSAKKKDNDDDDFDVFGDEADADVAEPTDNAPTESRAEMLARLKREAEERTAAKELKQRTLVAIEIKPFDVEQDLMSLWKKITETVTQDGLKWGENCNLADVAFGIKKIQCTFVMGVNNSSDDVVDKIMELYEDEVQSIEVTSMNVL